MSAKFGSLLLLLIYDDQFQIVPLPPFLHQSRAGATILNEAVSGVVACLVDEDEAHVRKSAVNALAHWLTAAAGRCFFGLCYCLVLAWVRWPICR